MIRYRPTYILNDMVCLWYQTIRLCDILCTNCVNQNDPNRMIIYKITCTKIWIDQKCIIYVYALWLLTHTELQHRLVWIPTAACRTESERRGILWLYGPALSSCVSRTGYHGSRYLATWESQPHHFSWEIKRVGPVDGPRPMAGAALLPGHGWFASGLRVDFRIKGLKRRTAKSKPVCYAWDVEASVPLCSDLSSRTFLSMVKLTKRGKKVTEIICCPHRNSWDSLDNTCNHASFHQDGSREEKIHKVKAMTNWCK